MLESRETNYHDFGISLDLNGCCYSIHPSIYPLSPPVEQTDRQLFVFQPPSASFDSSKMYPWNQMEIPSFIQASLSLSHLSHTPVSFSTCIQIES